MINNWGKPLNKGITGTNSSQSLYIQQKSPKNDAANVIEILKFTELILKYYHAEIILTIQ
jgi:hypothetical protein